MYKRDRARKLQMLRQKQLAMSQCSSGGSEASGGGGPLSVGSAAGVHYSLPPSASVSSPGLYSPEPGGPIKQEIQIPQLSSSTSSPDSSPSPLAGLVGQPMALVPQPHPTQQQHQGQQQQQQGPPPGGPPSAAAQQGHYPTAPTAAQPDKTAPPQAPPTPAWLTQGPSSPPKPFPTAYEQGPLVSPDDAKVPVLVREFQKNMLDDKEWQTQLFGLLQNQTYNQCEVDLFELMCKVIDQSLFAQVDWARSTIFFKDLRETKDEQQKADQTIWDRRSCERGSGRHVLRQLEVGSSCGRKIDFCGSGIGRARLRGSGRHNRRSNDYRKLRTSSRRQTRRSGIGGPGNVAPGDTAFGSSRLEVLVGSCEDMDIGVLKKEELLLLAVELSLDINSRLRKPEIRSAIIEGGFEEDELSEAWEKICDPTVGHPRVESFGGGGVCCVPLPVTSSRRARYRRHSVPRTQRLLRLTIVSRDGALAPRLGPAECGGGFGERKIRRCFLEGWVHPEQLSIELRGSRVPGGRFTPLIPPSDCGPPLPFVKWTDGPR
ncbi:hypothetical protein HPB51_010246 [Rhipicephalus microplus]|uniref:Uncharacterized protein n=1 Tax=Rhipicephalus microplus TaxID=6941 RepID=A0A9J6EGA4_RHIMP|nr:hypothetical protein HPB51_010246 [Rhipicephalus microplus]